MKAEGSSHVPEAVVGDIVAALDLVILERLPGGAMIRVGGEAPPAWFVETFHQVHRRQAVTLLEAFPVLDSFLSEAEIFWERTPDGRLEGEPVVVTSGGGGNLPLSVVAVAMKGRHFLLLQRVPGQDDRQHILQRARERALEHEEVVKRVDRLRRPAAALTRLAQELGTMDLAGPAQAHLAAIETELQALRTLLDELPEQPRGMSPTRGR